LHHLQHLFPGNPEDVLHTFVFQTLDQRYRQ
jgi:hypothetical protein